MHLTLGQWVVLTICGAVVLACANLAAVTQ
jgi:hypothetical protein